MLNLFSLKENKKLIEQTKKNYKKTSKHFPSPLREWKNSIYVFNKNSLNSITSATNAVNSIIKSYFNLYNKKIEVKLRTKRLLLRLRRSSSNKYYISNGGFKHTNNKVLINLYLFNRQKTNYLTILKKWYLKNFLKKTNKTRDINVKLVKRLELINKKGIEAVKTLNRDKYLLIKALNNVDFFKKNLQNKNFNLNTFKALSIYTENYYKNLIKKSLRKIKMYFYYKQLLYINRTKLNYTYLHLLKKNLEKIYNKNVEFNLINIKRFYLNSDILSESVAIKIARNRKKISKYLNVLKNKVKLKNKLSKILLNKNLNVEQNLSQNQPLLQNTIIDSLKYKHITGFRVQAKGRLNRRFTASRSTTKVRYKGNLLNTDSSFKGLSSVLLKGNLKSNTQFTKIKSKTRVGSFGIKGWVSGN